MLPVDEQMRIITSGASKIVPEADLKKKLERGVPLNIKLGVDPTSPDLHLGHAVPLRKMRQFQDLGHRVTVPLRKMRQFKDLGHRVTLIIGNGTATIGDPSGKNSTRPQLTQEEVEANAATYVSQAMKILDPEKTTIVHNGDWMFPMYLKELLSIASKFTVARILERDDFTKRYQSQTPIALHEFLYPIMQAYDDPEKTTIVHNGDWMFPMDLKELLSIASKFTVARILERDDCSKGYQSQTPIALHEFLYPIMEAYDSVKIEADVEMGGSDQRLNLLAGRELMEKMGMEPQIALTMPLLEGTDGTRKMSKSYGNRRWAWSRRSRSPCRCSRAPMAPARCPSPTATTSASPMRRPTCSARPCRFRTR